MGKGLCENQYLMLIFDLLHLVVFSTLMEPHCMMTINNNIFLQQLQKLDSDEGDEVSDEEETGEASESDSDSDLPSELDEDEAEMLRDQRSKGKYAQVEGGSDDEDDDDTGYVYKLRYDFRRVLVQIMSP